MEENVIVNDEKLDAVKDNFTPPNTEETETKVDGTDAKETVTYTEEEVSKKIQSETDKIRTKYSKEIKELKEKIEELSPTKTEAELEIERRLAELEKSQAEVNSQKQFLEMQNTLKAKGIDENIAAFLKDDVNLEEFSAMFNNILSEKVKSKGYVPANHPTGDNITAEQFKSMSYDERADLYTKNPTLYQKLSEQIR